MAAAIAAASSSVAAGTISIGNDDIRARLAAELLSSPAKLAADAPQRRSPT